MGTVGNVGAGAGAVAQYATQEVTGLTPSTVYHFTLVAENNAGPAEGIDMNFETPPAGPPAQSCPNATLRTENNSNALPECRAYEQVTPTDKNGYDAGSADGVMGDKTKVAIAAFQKDNGMEATGEVDETLVKKLLEKK